MASVIIFQPRRPKNAAHTDVPWTATPPQDDDDENSRLITQPEAYPDGTGRSLFFSRQQQQRWLRGLDHQTKTKKSCYEPQHSTERLRQDPPRGLVPRWEAQDDRFFTLILLPSTSQCDHCYPMSEWDPGLCSAIIIRKPKTKLEP